MAIIAKQKYTQDKIDKLFDYLSLYKEKGMPIDYEILVDGFKAVRRTSDTDMFSMFENFVTPQTRAIEILFYTGTSNNNEKHVFTFQDEDQGLSGIEIDTRIQEGIEKEKRSWEFDTLRKNNKELEAQIKELEAEIEALEKEKLEVLSKESPLKGLLGEMGSTFVESFIRRNPKLLSKIPGGDALAGLIEDDNKEKELDQEHDQTEVIFKSKSSASTSQTLSQEDEYAITFVNQLKTSFSKSEFDKVLEILERFAAHKEGIEEVLSDLKNRTHEQI